MSSINIRKKINFPESDIEIIYHGNRNSNTDLNKINFLLTDFLNNHSHNNMLENVRIIRTIFKDCDENLLAITYHDTKGTELVKYKSSKLIIYEKSQREDKGHHYNKYIIKYEEPNGLRLYHSNLETVSEEFEKMLKQINDLKNAKAVPLDLVDKTLIEIYKLFYDENPNFTSKDINIKVQTMICILANFGISLEDNYGFRIYEREQMPLSFDLQQRVNKLYALGEVNNLEDRVKLAEEPKKIIKIVGDSIREKISKSQNSNEDLITLSKVFHAGKYHLSSENNVKKLSELTECPTSEVEDSLKLVRCIENKINKNDD